MKTERKRENDPIGWTRIVAPLWNDKPTKRYTFRSLKVFKAYEQAQSEHLNNKSSVMPLEKYVMERGFVRHGMNWKTIQWEPTSRYLYSTMGDLIYSYQHPDGRCVQFGLNQSGHPPGLTYPRPKIVAMINGKMQNVRIFDAAMERVAQKYSPEEIFNACFDNNIVFEIDATDLQIK